MHFVIGAMLMIPMLSSIIVKLLKSAFKTSNKMMSMKQKVGSAFQKSGAKKLIIMGSMVTFLLILQLIAIANIFPKVAEYADKDEEYDACKYGAIAQYAGDECLEDESCCDYTDPSKLGVAPPAVLLAFGYFFPLSMISLVYAFVCVNDKGHKTVWKGMLGLKGKASSKTAPSGSSQVSTY